MAIFITKLCEDEVIKFIEYSKNKTLIAKQQKNGVNVAKQNYAIVWH